MGYFLSPVWPVGEEGGGGGGGRAKGKSYRLSRPPVYGFLLPLNIFKPIKSNNKGENSIRDARTPQPGEIINYGF